jgi:hypothetical protein
MPTRSLSLSLSTIFSLSFSLSSLTRIIVAINPGLIAKPVVWDVGDDRREHGRDARREVAGGTGLGCRCTIGWHEFKVMPGGPGLQLPRNFLGLGTLFFDFNDI